MNSTHHNVCFVGQAIKGLISSQTKAEASPFEFRIADTVVQFQKDWDLIVPPQSIIHSSSCLIFEHSSSQNIRYRYAMAYHDGKPVLATCYQLVKIKPSNIHKNIENEFLRFATNTFLSLHDIQLLVVGNVFREESASSYHASVLPGKKTDELLQYLLEKIREKECASAILYKETDDEFGPSHKSLKLDDDISMVLEIRKNWLKWEDYIQDLTKKYAARAKKIMASANDLQTKDLQLEEIEANKTVLQGLYEQVTQKQEFVFGTLTENYWSAQREVHKDRFSIKAVFLNDKMVAFMSFFSRENELEVHYVGIDYACNQNYPLYFYLHFLAVQEAINGKKQRLLMGRTSLEAKAILGCTPIYHYSHLQFYNSLFECAYGALRKSMVETENWKTRNPLRVPEPQELLQSTQQA